MYAHRDVLDIHFGPSYCSHMWRKETCPPGAYGPVRYWRCVRCKRCTLAYNPPKPTPAPTNALVTMWAVG